jgi:RNA polymerase sigma-70 factor (ECF subfamily)
LSGATAENSNYEMSDPDVRLMLQVRNDDAAAFEELVARYQNRLIAVLDHLVGQRQTAEDLTQEVFLRVYRARKTYSPDARFSTWIYRIAHNVASNWLRMHSRRREVRAPAANVGDTDEISLEQLAKAASGLHPSRRLDKTELSDIVRLAMECLPEQQRMALLLSKFEEMSYADVAQAMELTVSSVKSLLWRARENLRVVLEPYLQQGLRPERKS